MPFKLSNEKNTAINKINLLDYYTPISIRMFVLANWCSASFTKIKLLSMPSFLIAPLCDLGNSVYITAETVTQLN